MRQGSIFRSYDIGKLLDRKYANAEASTAAQTLSARAGMLDAQSGARRVDPQNALNTAQASLFGAQAELYPQVAGAEMDFTRANTRNVNATAMGTEQDNRTGFGARLAGMLFPTQAAGGSVGSGMAPSRIGQPFRFGASVRPTRATAPLSMGEDYDPLRG